ncbi:MAG TPA: UDP-N-acetylmuramoyl-L-alanyl-D-glutamate--2,6-diaminopimelate ligase [Steroidobacteraceae bacterium]|nr:UDP-N-acetylmuramoyl-L-alanyl-D-glutamate--2,6-diaminopimelate ligase [Steroidobacteraceae bacterium]
MNAVRHIPNEHITLRELLRGAISDAALPQLSSVDVQHLTLNSRDVKPGSAFIAIPGLRAHGIDYAAQAVANGASVVLWEPVDDRAMPALSGATVVAVPHLSAMLGDIANRFYGEPSHAMRIAAVTGTNGKSTTAYMIAEAAQRCGMIAGYSGTVGYGLIDHLKNATHTTPDVINVHRQLAEIRDEGAIAAGMEVSSHALHQHRIAAVQIDTAVFTNLTRDHLDYHGSMQAYGEAKAALFQHPGLRHAVINADDVFGRELLSRPLAAKVMTAFGCESSQGFNRMVQATGVRLSERGLQLNITGSFGDAVLQSSLLGKFNAYNLLATLAVLLGWDISLNKAVAALEQSSAPPGRMETHRDAHGKLVVIDYAHSPDALEKALQELKVYCRGKLVCVFGCGGNRDAGKRVQMGAIAERLADQIILTDDNPRYEDPQQIINGILRGIKHPDRVVVERDRAKAIARSIDMASSQDIVLIAGKGHEDYQIIGDVTAHFSDREVVQACLRGAA